MVAHVLAAVVAAGAVVSTAAAAAAAGAVDTVAAWSVASTRPGARCTIGRLGGKEAPTEPGT